MSKVCKVCNLDMDTPKKWGYANLCDDCDAPETVRRSMGIVIADGKTDYHIQVVKNPSAEDAEFIRSVGRAWDPRTQLKSINKVSR